MKIQTALGTISDGPRVALHIKQKRVYSKAILNDKLWDKIDTKFNGICEVSVVSYDEECNPCDMGVTGDTIRDDIVYTIDYIERNDKIDIQDISFKCVNNNNYASFKIPKEYKLYIPGAKDTIKFNHYSRYRQIYYHKGLNRLVTTGMDLQQMNQTGEDKLTVYTSAGFVVGPYKGLMHRLSYNYLSKKKLTYTKGNKNITTSSVSAVLSKYDGIKNYDMHFLLQLIPTKETMQYIMDKKQPLPPIASLTNSQILDRYYGTTAFNIKEATTLVKRRKKYKITPRTKVRGIGTITKINPAKSTQYGKVINGEILLHGYSNPIEFAAWSDNAAVISRYDINDVIEAFIYCGQTRNGIGFVIQGAHRWHKQ